MYPPAGSALQKVLKGSNLQFEAMFGRPIHMNRICGFHGYAFPDQLNDDVLRAQD